MLASSLQYVAVTVLASKAGAPVNPTGDPVQLAFTTAGADPQTGDFHAATWQGATSPYVAQILVGPGGTVTLTAGLYAVWVKVTDSPEIPILYAGSISVT